MHVEVEASPVNRRTDTIDKVRGGGGTDGNNVAVVNNTVTVDILILDITRLHIAEHLFGRITDIIIVGKQPLGNKTS